MELPIPDDMTSLERMIQHIEHQMASLQTSDGEPVTSVVSDVTPSGHFRSSISLDGEPILPPLVTRQRRAECVTYRHQAVLAEARMRAKRKDRLLAQVQEALDTVEETSPRSRIFADHSLLEPGKVDTPKAGALVPAQTSAQSPPVQRNKLPSDLQESSSSGGDVSYMFHSSDSSEYQTTVIARDEDSDLKQVSRILREERLAAGAGKSEVPDPAALETTAADSQDKIRRPSGESTVSDPGVTPRSKGLSRALGLVKDRVGSNERLQREDDISSTTSSDQMYSTGSTDIMQYMKVSVSPFSSSTTTTIERPPTAQSDVSEATVVEISGAECGETSTDPPKRKEHSRMGKHEHLKRYLHQLSAQPLNTSSGSHNSELNSTGGHSNDQDVGNSVSMQDLQNAGLEQNKPQERRQSDFGASVTEEELLIFQSQQFEDKRRQLELHQRQQLEKLMEEQRREKEKLQQEMLEQEERLRLAQNALHPPQSLLPPQAQNALKQDLLVDSEPDDSPRGMPFGRVPLRGSNRYHVDNRYSYHESAATPPEMTSGHDSDPDTPIRAIAASRRRMEIVRVPEKALAPEMKEKFDRVSAAVKGYLTRRLLRTEKVRGLIKTIKDTAEFAISFHSEASIKNGVYSMQDLSLQERVIAQLRAALLEVHEIFFDLSTRERMHIIDQSRQLEQERRYRAGSLKRTMSDGRGKKLSLATQKAMERKRHARQAELAMLSLSEEMNRHRESRARQHRSTDHSHSGHSGHSGHSDHRPASSDPISHHTDHRAGHSEHAEDLRSHRGDSRSDQPHKLKTMDISGPIRRQFHSIFNRALRPIQGQSSPVKPVKPGSDKDAAGRPLTAPAKVRTRTTTPKEDQPHTRVKKTDPAAGTKRAASKASSTSSKSSAANVPTTRLKSVSNPSSSPKLLSKPTLTTVPVASTNRRH